MANSGWHYYSKKRKVINIFNKNKKYLLLFLILALAFLLGAPMILHGDFYFLSDQARDMLLTRDIVLNHEITLIGTHSGIGGFFHGPIWLYSLAPFFIIGGGSPFAFTYYFILIQLLTILAGFFITKNLYGYKIGISSAFILALDPVLWKSVPNTYGINLIPLIFIFIIFSLIKFLKGDRKYFIIASFFAGISLHFETALSLVLIPALFVVFFAFSSKKRLNVKLGIMSVGSYLIAILSFILFDLRHNFLMFNSLIVTVASKEHGQGYLYFGQRIKDHLQSLISIYSGFLFDANKLLIIVTMLIGVGGLYLMRKNKKNISEAVLLFTFPILCFVFFSFYPYRIYSEYVLGLTIPIVLFFALCVKNIKHTIWGKLFIFLFMLINFCLVFNHLSMFNKYQQNLTAGSFRNQENVVNWIISDSKENKFGYFVYTPETFTYGMDYLMWYKTKNLGGTAESKKLSTSYLIMYPPLEGDSSAHLFWKENIIKTKTKSINTKIFPGNIIVEKVDLSKDTEEVDQNYFQNLIFR